MFAAPERKDREFWISGIPPRFRRRDAKDGFWRKLSGEAWIHVTSVLAFVQSAG